jgi:hypothetical protein
LFQFQFGKGLQELLLAATDRDLAVQDLFVGGKNNASTGDDGLVKPIISKGADMMLA